MNASAQPDAPREALPPSRAVRWASLACFLAGIAAAILLARQIPPAPPFSPALNRASYWQSYETAYFASLRTYEKKIQDALDGGYLPIVVFGDSSIRGSGAVGEEVWTRVLERRLRSFDERVRVLNFAQNAGDLMGPFLYHYLQRRYPQAHYIVQWHFSSEVAVRHPFHFWLTSEIKLRDGDKNPAVRRSYKLMHITRPDEQAAFIMAEANILTRYLDVGNWVRYLWLGRPFYNGDRQLDLEPLAVADESDVSYTHFIKLEDQAMADRMSRYFTDHQKVRNQFVHRPLADRQAYFNDMYPPAQRSHLLLITGDFNPYYAPHQDAEQMNIWRTMWAQLRTDMAKSPDLRWLSLTGSSGDMGIDDYSDLGHFTVSGQAKLAHAVADKLLGPGGWFDASQPEAIQPAPKLSGAWYELKTLPPALRETFRFMQPVPVKFYSQFGPTLDGEFFGAHPDTALVFAVAAGRHHLHLDARLAASAYENIAEAEATDGVEVRITATLPSGEKRLLLSRLINPRHVPADRGIVGIDLDFEVPRAAEIEVFAGPGPAGNLARDWFSLGHVRIQPRSQP